MEHASLDLEAAVLNLVSHLALYLPDFVYLSLARRPGCG